MATPNDIRSHGPAAAPQDDVVASQTASLKVYGTIEALLTDVSKPEEDR